MIVSVFFCSDCTAFLYPFSCAPIVPHFIPVFTLLRLSRSVATVFFWFDRIVPHFCSRLSFASTYRTIYCIIFILLRSYRIFASVFLMLRLWPQSCVTVLFCFDRTATLHRYPFSVASIVTANRNLVTVFTRFDFTARTLVPLTWYFSWFDTLRMYAYAPFFFP